MKISSPTMSKFAMFFGILFLLALNLPGHTSAQTIPSDRDLFDFPQTVDLYFVYSPQPDQAAVLAPATGVEIQVFEMTPFEQVDRGLIDPSEWRMVDTIAFTPDDTVVLRTSSGALYKLAYTPISPPPRGFPDLPAKLCPAA